MPVLFAFVGIVGVAFLVEMWRYHEPGAAIHRLALSQMTRAFNDVDDKEILTKIAQEHGLSGEAPTGTKTHVLQNNVAIFTGATNGYAVGTGPSYASVLVVHAGDTIDFAVGRGSNNTCVCSENCD